jgi:hypothetical protein
MSMNLIVSCQNEQGEEAVGFFFFFVFGANAADGMMTNPFTFPSVLRVVVRLEALEFGK